MQRERSGGIERRSDFPQDAHKGLSRFSVDIMKQLFCDLGTPLEEKSVEIRVRFGNEAIGSRAHYCTGLQRVCDLDVDGLCADARVYCPLCGALTPNRWPDVRGGDVPKPADFAGPPCAHGYPDATCEQIVALDDSFEYPYRRGIPEYALWVACRDLAEFPVLSRWARPCPLCRSEYARVHRDAIERELRAVHRALGLQSNAVATEIQSAINTADALLHSLRDRDTAQPPADGYVYAITDGDAIKIGWTRRPPAGPGGRLVQLQTAHPRKLRLLGVVAGALAAEANLHRRFAAYRLHGEWFRYVPDIVEYFERR